jgi:hypothetical protein
LARTVTIILPAQGTLDVSDLPQFTAVVDDLHAVIDEIGAVLPRKVPRRLIRSLDSLREDLIALGGTTMVTAAVITGS